MTEMLDSRLSTKCILKLNSIILVQKQDYTLIN